MLITPLCTVIIIVQGQAWHKRNTKKKSFFSIAKCGTWQYKQSHNAFSLISVHKYSTIQEYFRIYLVQDNLIQLICAEINRATQEHHQSFRIIFNENDGCFTSEKDWRTHAFHGSGVKRIENKISRKLLFTSKLAFLWFFQDLYCRKMAIHKMLQRIKIYVHRKMRRRYWRTNTYVWLSLNILSWKEAWRTIHSSLKLQKCSTMIANHSSYIKDPYRGNEIFRHKRMQTADWNYQCDTYLPPIIIIVIQQLNYGVSLELDHRSVVIWCRDSLITVVGFTFTCRNTLRLIQCGANNKTFPIQLFLITTDSK